MESVFSLMNKRTDEGIYSGTLFIICVFDRALLAYNQNENHIVVSAKYFPKISTDHSL